MGRYYIIETPVTRVRSVPHETLRKHWPLLLFNRGKWRIRIATMLVHHRMATTVAHFQDPRCRVPTADDRVSTQLGPWSSKNRASLIDSKASSNEVRVLTPCACQLCSHIHVHNRFQSYPLLNHE